MVPKPKYIAYFAITIFGLHSRNLGWFIRISYSFCCGFLEMSNIPGVIWWFTVVTCRKIISCETHQKPQGASHSALHSAIYFFGGCLALCLMCFNLFEGHFKRGGPKFEEFQVSWKLSRKSGECLELHEVLIMFNCANGEWEFQNPEKNGENSTKKS